MNCKYCSYPATVKIIEPDWRAGEKIWLPPVYLCEVHWINNWRGFNSGFIKSEI